MAMSTLEQLTRQRAGARSWLTRTTQKLLTLTEKPEVTKEEIEVSLEEITKRTEKLNLIQEQIEIQLEPSELESDISEAERYFDSAADITARARRKLKDIILIPGPQAGLTDSLSSVGPAQGEISPSLPKIEMTKFNGNFSEWPSFFDKFSALIGNTKLPDISKFTYLQSLLLGDAKRAIEGLALTADNYSVAIDILKDRFGRRERIIFGHVQNLLATDFQNSRHVKMLWNVFNHLQTNIRSLETLGVDGANYGLVLTPLIVSRLPPDIRLMWARHSHQKEGDLDFLMSFLKGEIENRERSQSFVPIVPRESHEHRTKLPNQRPTASALTLTTKDLKCAFCSGGHFNDKCKTVSKMNVDDVKVKLKQNNLCFICFRKGHIARKCFSHCRLCRKKHNEIFCENKFKNNDSDRGLNEPSILSDSEGTNVTFCKSKHSGKNSVLQTLKIHVKGVPVTVLFDSGSDKSFITSKTVARIKPAFCGRESLHVSSFQTERPLEKVIRNVYEVKLDLNNGKKEKLRLTEVEVICAAMFKPAIPDDLLSYFQNCQFSDDIQDSNQVIIDILIGQDYYWKLIKADCCIPSPCGLVAQKTVFGQWVLSGVYSDRNSQSLNPYRQFLCLADIPQSEFRKMWDLEYLECKHLDHACNPTPKVLEKFSEQIRYIDGRYEVALPWLDENKIHLQSNEVGARKRLEGLNRKLAKDVDLKEGYNEAFRKMEAEGIIEEVIEDLEPNIPNPVFYLPHRPVVKSSSLSTKIRPVFDASASGPNAISLNDCMETGPNLLPLLSDILIRFRRHKIAICADIEKAFLQVSVRPEDRDVHRFLWLVDNRVRTMRITRVPFGNKASPFLLNATVRHHLSQYPPTKRVIRELSENMYCDDWLSGGDSEEEALALMSEASKIMGEAGMRLCKWSSNGDKVAESIQRCFQDKTVETDTVKVLGIRWIPKGDVLTFDGISISPDIVITKRLILSCIARTFDPLGLISPFTILAKMLFQEAWKLGLDWDEQVPIDMGKQFSSWIEGLSKLRELSIPRCYVSFSWGEKTEVELHCFCDSSLKGYGAVVYLKVTEWDGSTTTTLVLSKARVAPLKPVSLPRLELLGAVVGAKLLHSVINIMHLPDGVRYFCWTDSAVVLQWIRSEPTRWKMFVCNRVAHIQELTAPEAWHHCSGKENPADCLTRGLSAADILHKPLWFEGPSWLKFPTKERDQTVSVSGDTTINSNEQAAEVNVCLIKTDDILDIKRWGEFSRAVRIIAWIFRFTNNSRQKDSRHKSFNLSGEEIDFAFLKLLSYIQHLHFPDEMERLSIQKGVRKDSPLHKMNPFLDEQGIMKMKGRLQFADLSDKEKYPIILPKCYLTLLIVRREHIKLKHAGVSQMLTALRNQFWILGLRSLAKKVKRQCVRCQRYDSMPCSQSISPLPLERLFRTNPFSVTGLDFAGPLYTVDAVGKKFYILLFTCCVVRAIHIELCEGQSLNEFLLAFRRFVARRGMPARILSDNAKTFQAAAKQLTNRHMEESPKWIFNVPRAPWRGGVWERLIRSIKMSLKKTVGTSKLSKVELETVLLEIESCINSRPLTSVCDDPEDTQVLSPSHFLLGRSNTYTPASEPNEPLLTGDLAREAFACAKKRLDRFWEIWQKDYIRNLPLIRSSPLRSQVKVGSIVLLQEDNCPRMFWPLARVVRLLPGRDNVVRTVEVKTAKGTFIRAVQRVHCLEMENELFSADECSPTNLGNKGADSDNSEGDSSVATQKPSDSNDKSLEARKPFNGARTKITTRGRVIKPPVRLDF